MTSPLVGTIAQRRRMAGDGREPIRVLRHIGARTLAALTASELGGWAAVIWQREGRSH